jgi:hypothetical protein
MRERRIRFEPLLTLPAGDDPGYDDVHWELALVCNPDDVRAGRWDRLVLVPDSG